MWLEYNLQFFAKDGPGGEKTEPATAKKLEDARKEGNVAKSKELVSSIMLFALFVLLKVYVGTLGANLIEIFRKFYNIIPDTAATVLAEGLSIGYVGKIMTEAFKSILLIIAPILLVAFIITTAIDIWQVKWKPTGKPLMPKLSKLNPLSGFKKIFSVKAVVELIKSIAMMAIVVYVAYTTIKDKYTYILNLYDVTLNEALGIIGDIVINMGIKISAIFLLIGFVDYLYQKKKFSDDMKMTKQEVKDEYKSSEGDPQIKGKIRRKMLEVSRRRMMQDLPKADVVITNPTHFAVAIMYDADTAKAPIVLAKGADYLAFQIREKAKEYNIEIVENNPLARMLYNNVEIGMEIPQELYQAVAEVLAFVYSLKKK